MSWLSVGSAAVSVIGGYITSKQNAKSNKALAQAQEKQDPYGPYRQAAALKLNNLMDHPESIQDTAEYKSRQTAASRMMASQGYTGSGNALAAAAEAGGNSYQQAFNNLAMLSGAGVAPGQGAVAAASQMSANNQYANNQYGQIANGLVAAGTNIYNRWQDGQANANWQSSPYNPARQPQPISQPGADAFAPAGNYAPPVGF